MNIYERMGRMVEERDQEHAHHLATIHLLHRLKSGEVPLDELFLTPNGWKIVPAGTNRNGDREAAVGVHLEEGG